jgi:hypothetical protein
MKNCNTCSTNHETCYYAQRHGKPLKNCSAWQPRGKKARLEILTDQEIRKIHDDIASGLTVVVEKEYLDKLESNSWLLDKIVEALGSVVKEIHKRKGK